MHSDTSNSAHGYEFSENQKNLWLLGKDNQQSFFNQLIIKFSAEITSDALQTAINEVCKKHDVISFKTHYDKNFTYPTQLSIDNFSIDYHEIQLETTDPTSSVHNALNHPYDASVNSPIRFCGVKISGKLNYLGIRLYALWGDMYSIFFFCKELSKALIDSKAYKNGETENVDYLNFCAWQNELINQPDEEALQFWKVYDYDLNQKVIPFIRDTPLKFLPLKRHILTIEGEKYDAIKNYAADNGFQISDVLLLNFISYLSLFTEKEITIGYLPFERHYEELANTLGLISKVLPLKATDLNALSKDERIKVLRKQIDQLINWSDYFSINRESNLKKIAVLNYCFEFVPADNVGVSQSFQIEDIYSVQDEFELKLKCVDMGDKISIHAYYDYHKLEKEGVDTIEAQLKEWFGKDSLETKKAPMISKFEKGIAEAVNATDTKFSNYISVLDLFELQVKKKPDAIAIIYEDRKWTYRELSIKADQFAIYLVANHNIKKGSAVCVLLERSDWFIISILGILRTGCYYVPIDVSYPEERIRFILNDCKCTVLICFKEFVSKYNLGNIAVLDPITDNVCSTTGTLPVIERKSDDIAYCIYTSGSTGLPKGCLITNQNLMNYIQWSNHFYFDDSTVGNWALITSVSFDLTVTSIYTSLTRGGQLWIGSNQNDIYDVLKESFTNKSIEILKLTPTHLSLLKDLDIKETGVKTVICGGEQLTKNQVDNLWRISPAIRIYNEYGPTEATVGCIVKEILPTDSTIVIGKPIANTKVFILNESGGVCPLGVTGEIGITGMGLAKGYLNQDELTTQKFVEHPVIGERLYCTGDRARMFPDGCIEYLGRTDNQVKIRGYRFELNEIESILIGNEHINEAIVLVLEDEDMNKKLTAFITGDGQISLLAVRDYLADKIPYYMIPEDFIQVERFQLTVNGKIDKGYLIGLKSKSIVRNVEYVAPGNDIEENLVEIWEGILNKERIGVNDNFFALGGNSLLVMKLINRIGNDFGMKIDFKSFFNKPTISSLALEILFMNEQKSLKSNNLTEVDI